MHSVYNKKMPILCAETTTFTVYTLVHWINDRVDLFNRASQHWSPQSLWKLFDGLSFNSLLNCILFGSLFQNVEIVFNWVEVSTTGRYSKDMEFTLPNVVMPSFEFCLGQPSCKTILARGAIHLSSACGTAHVTISASFSPVIDSSYYSQRTTPRL